MKILSLIDVFGWAHEFAARGWAKYSRHEVNWLPVADLTRKMLRDYDAFLVSTRNTDSLGFALPWDKTIGIIHSMHPAAFAKLKRYRAVIGVSKQISGQAMIQNCGANIEYIRNAVDGEIFKPGTKLGRYIGWAGDRRRKLKRSHLLLQLEIPENLINIKSDWGNKFLVKGRNQDDQVQYLQSLYCYIQPSDTEGMSLATLEAGACGLPIVATNVGDTKYLVSSDWLLPVPEGQCVQRMNQLVRNLMENRNLAIRVGTQNWKRFHTEGWCWSKRAKKYDDFFSETFGEKAQTEPETVGATP